MRSDDIDGEAHLAVYRALTRRTEVASVMVDENPFDARRIEQHYDWYITYRVDTDLDRRACELMHDRSGKIMCFHMRVKGL